MRVNPRGAIIRTMRLVEKDVTEDGAEVTISISAPGIIVRLAHVEGRKPSDVRRDFNRFCRNNGIIATPCEHSEGHYSRRTGNAIPGTEDIASAYQCVGAVEALEALTGHYAVGEWGYAVSVRIPVVAGGNGPEKVRPSMGSAFGKPAQVKATQAALARQGDEIRTAQRKQWAQG